MKDNIINIVNSFIEIYNIGISSIYKTYYHDNDILKFSSFIEEIKPILIAKCNDIINNSSSIDEVYDHLFNEVNSFAKENAISLPKIITGYYCPGCLYLDNKSILDYNNDILHCKQCNETLKHKQKPKDIYFYTIFSKHLKKGYRCPDCKRFIPHPLYDITSVSCPYFDCCFVGEINNLKRMNHPSFQYNEDVTLNTLDDNFDKNLLCISDLDNNVKVINDVIDDQINNAPYNGSDFTLVHKIATYKAFKNLLYQFPEDMVNYLLYQSRTGGFQHKIFQEYVKLIEKSLPICYKKKGKVNNINSILDDRLNIFEGISTFESVINDKLEIKNETKEVYIGGRKAFYAKPYYIGKLLSVIEKESNKPIIDNVVEYSFSKIKLKDVIYGTNVIVSHLRIPPHYQMGGMVYINRLKKVITDKSLILLGK